MVSKCPMQASSDVIEEDFPIQIDSPPRKWSFSKRTWIKVVRIDLKKCNLLEDLAQDKEKDLVLGPSSKYNVECVRFIG